MVAPVVLNEVCYIVQIYHLLTRVYKFCYVLTEITQIKGSTPKIKAIAIIICIGLVFWALDMALDTGRGAGDCRIIDLHSWEHCSFFNHRMLWCLTPLSTIFQRSNQNPYIKEEQTTQWQKEKVQKDKQRSTKHT
jgi:hypothetical protein